MGEIDKIVFVHTFNNFTGSPKVLGDIVDEFSKNYKTTLLSSKTAGFLSGKVDVIYKYNFYKWSDNSFLRLPRFVITHVYTFFYILFSSRKSTIYYLNTITCFSAAAACRLTRKKFVFHVHEPLDLNKKIYSIYRAIYRWTNKKSVFVSRYVMNCAPSLRSGRVVYNALESDFTSVASEFLKQPEVKVQKVGILMISSLKKFKGIDEFVVIAQSLPQFSFELVISASTIKINSYFVSTKIQVI